MWPNKYTSFKLCNEKKTGDFLQVSVVQRISASKIQIILSTEYTKGICDTFV